MTHPNVGLVIRLDRKQCLVELDGEQIPCAIRGRFFEDPDPASRPVAVGDRVRIVWDGELGTIEEILPRTTQVRRRVPRAPHKTQIIAANVDLLVLVVSLKKPAVRASLVDRLLVEAESSNLDAALVVNKTDLVSELTVAAFVEPYQALQYPVFASSALHRTGLEPVAEELRDRVSLLLGPSGVGKSALLNALDPDQSLRVGSVRERDGKGRHTTTYANLLRLGFGGSVVDAPGVREFGLVGVEEADLGAYFRDLRRYHDKCRYPRCTHDHEPRCAVKEAVEAGLIREERYRSYLRLLKHLQGEDSRMPRHDSF